MNILVYFDKGVDRGGVHQTVRALRGALSYFPYDILRVDASYFLNRGWEKNTALVVIPGGRDVFYHRALQGEANARIASFVERGGAYLGICAGAYYGAAAVEFEKGGKLQVCASRELAFFPGKAIGPAYGNGLFRYESEEGSKAASLQWAEGTCSLYFNGGCYFDRAEKYPQVRIIAHYRDISHKPAAIVECQIHKGRAILSGVHPEYQSYSITTKNPHFEEIHPSLLIDDEKRKVLWKGLLTSLFLQRS